MRGLIGRWVWALVIAACMIGNPVNAGPIVDGREWYQPNDVTNYSWSDFNAICAGGPCNGQVGGTGPDLTGWVWASVYEVGALFHAMTPHPGGIASYTDSTPFQDPIWVYQFLGVFDRTVYDPNPFSGSMGVAGLTATRDSATGTPYWGIVGAYINGYVAPGIPEIDGTVRTGLVNTAFPDDRIGAWLYRADATVVPTPGTASLLVIALVGLVKSRNSRTLNRRNRH